MNLHLSDDAAQKEEEIQELKERVEGMTGTITKRRPT